MAADNVASNPPSDNAGPTSNPAPGIGQATIDAPSLNKSGTQLLLEAKSVKHVGHAWNICRATEQANQYRSSRCANVQSLHDGAPPRNAAIQAEKAKSWQSNASTNWLSGINGRVAQRFVHAIINQLYVTSSALPEDIPDWKTKTDLMRAKFTTLVRSWNGYTGFINSECVETVLQGYCYAVFLDPYTWKPTFFKQDWAFVPEFSGQHSREWQFFVAKMDYRLDEFISLFSDESSASEVGYNIENCVKAANASQPANPPEDAQTTQYRTFVEMVNDGVLGLTYSPVGPRIVKTYLLFNREYDGKVSFWLIERDKGTLLRYSHKLFPTMEDAIAAFSFEPGNGCIHSSKGLGRKLYNLACMKEIFRNGIIDNSRMSGLTIIRCSGGDKTKFAPAMVAPFLIIDKDVEIPEQQFVANSEGYKTVDNLIDAWAEQSVGAYLTQQLDDQSRTEKTATEAQIDARRETEAADIQIRRQLDQFSTMTQVQQLRVFSDQNIDDARQLFEDITKDAKLDVPEIYARKGNDPEVMRMLVECMKGGVSDDEMKIWRKSPASPYAHVSEAALQQGIEIVAAENAQQPNPNVDQARLAYRRLEGRVGADEAQKLWIPLPDETVVSEAKRQQIIETNTMNMSALPVPVSQRDNHIIHGATLQEYLKNVLGPILSGAEATPQVERLATLNLNHWGEHLQFAQGTDLAKTPAFEQQKEFYEDFKKSFAESVQIRAAAKASATAVMDQIRAEDAPPPAEQEMGTVEQLPPPVTSPVTSSFELPSIPPRTGPTREPAVATA